MDMNSQSWSIPQILSATGPTIFTNPYPWTNSVNEEKKKKLWELVLQHWYASPHLSFGSNGLTPFPLGLPFIYYPKLSLLRPRRTRSSNKNLCLCLLWCHLPFISMIIYINITFVYRFSRSLRSPQVPEFAFYSQSGMEEVSAPCYQLSSSAALIGNYVPFSEALSWLSRAGSIGQLGMNILNGINKNVLVVARTLFY